MKIFGTHQDLPVEERLKRLEKSNLIKTIFICMCMIAIVSGLVVINKPEIMKRSIICDYLETRSIRVDGGGIFIYPNVYSTTLTSAWIYHAEKGVCSMNFFDNDSEIDVRSVFTTLGFALFQNEELVYNTFGYFR